MKSYRPAVAALTAVIAVGCWAVVGSGQQVPLPAQAPLPLEPLGSMNEAIFPAFEGWGPHKDGQNVILLGYFNRNKNEESDIPIGPTNKIEPAGPDYGQPTHFENGRKYGVFSIQVPKDFGNKKLTWTITINGQTSNVTFWLNPAYWIDYFKNTANQNEPPVIKFAENGPTTTGPARGIMQTLTGTPWNPVELKFWAADRPADSNNAERGAAAARGRGTDPAGRGGRGADGGRGAGDGRGRGVDATVAIINGQVIGARGAGGGGGGGGGFGRGGGPPADIRVSWHKHRGPGDITYDTDEIRLLNKGDANLFLEAKTNAYFSAPGEYILRAQVNDQSGDGGGGDQCCWTTAHVKVIIK